MPPPTSDAKGKLEVVDLHAAYGDLVALRGVTLEVGPDEIVALVGANGAGKTTLLECVVGLVPRQSGSLRWRGEDLTSIGPHEVVERGLAMVPERRRLFPAMTVQENLELGAYTPRARSERRASLERIFEIFPRLAERRAQLAGSLSGGEQQMVAIGRALMARPALLMLDEPSLGLAPQIVEAIFGVLDELHRAGLALLLVEQNVQAALTIAQRAYVLEGGQIVGAGRAADLLEDPRVREAYLGPLAVAP